ncbi:MAG TPA: PH domain-containing protein [Stellaceae bacterium]|nr:PH domain-containing protein [Steroidobacteraceae bacterium]HEV2548629.1 PH domain-containing protein [Stellaceae bacterium]
MSYVDSTLLPGEQVTFRTHLHWIIFVRAAAVVLIGVIFLVSAHYSASLSVIGGILVLIGLVLWLAAYIHRRTSEFAVTNKRIIVKVGILQRRTMELLLRQVEALEVDQGILGRIFGYGTLLIIGTGGTREPFQRISKPLEFRRATQAASTAS